MRLREDNRFRSRCPQRTGAVLDSSSAKAAGEGQEDPRPESSWPWSVFAGTSPLPNSLTTWGLGRGLRFPQWCRPGPGQVLTPEGRRRWLGWGLASCQVAILPAQPVAAPDEAPRAGVIIRVPVTSRGCAVRAWGAPEGLRGGGCPAPPHPVHRQKAWWPNPRLSACSAVMFR